MGVTITLEGPNTFEKHEIANMISVALKANGKNVFLRDGTGEDQNPFPKMHGARQFGKDGKMADTAAIVVIPSKKGK